jgi:hypothetical protein
MSTERALVRKVYYPNRHILLLCELNPFGSGVTIGIGRIDSDRFTFL